MSGIPAWAVPGARVVCVDDVFSEGHKRICAALPIAGGVYTIRKVTFVDGADTAPAVLLEEVVNEYTETMLRGFLWRGEPRFGLRRFRPLHTLETDISEHFSQHLHVREPERV